MKLKTVRVRRSRPSALALALALMLTMLFVYLISLSAGDSEADQPVNASTTGRADVRMEALSVAFTVEARCDALLEARIEAAKCAERGGAGLILADGSRYAVIREACSTDAAPEGAITRSADGLTLRLRGQTGEVNAIADAAAFLRSQASETGSLAAALERGDTNTGSVAALLRIYQTQGGRAQTALAEVESTAPAVTELQSAVQSGLSRLDAAISDPNPGKLRLIHAAACAEWIRLLTELSPS